jgi:putative transcriptional regulator
MFGKNEKSNLSKAERNALAKMTETLATTYRAKVVRLGKRMSKRAFEKIAEGLSDAIAIARGEADPATYRIHVPPTIDVKAIRKRKGMTQVEFASRYQLNLARLRDWEQRRSNPDSAARAYLLVIEKEPEAVERALSTQSAA